MKYLNMWYVLLKRETLKYFILRSKPSLRDTDLFIPVIESVLWLAVSSYVPDMKALSIGQYRESSTQRPFGTDHNNPVGHTHTQQIHTEHTISASALM